MPPCPYGPCASFHFLVPQSEYKACKGIGELREAWDQVDPGQGSAGFLSPFHTIYLQINVHWSSVVYQEQQGLARALSHWVVQGLPLTFSYPRTLTCVARQAGQRCCGCVSWCRTQEMGSRGTQSNTGGSSPSRIERHTEHSTRVRN